MLIEDTTGLSLPETISRDSIKISVETEKMYLNILYLSLALLIAGVGFLKAIHYFLYGY